MNLQRMPLPWNINWRQPLITKNKKRLYEGKKVKWSLQSEIGNKHKCWKLDRISTVSFYFSSPVMPHNRVHAELEQVITCSSSAINDNFDDISHLSINHLATNRNDCTNITKPWLVSVLFVAITKCWCLFGLWQPALTAKCIHPGKYKCVCVKQIWTCVRRSQTKENVSVTAQQALNISGIQFVLMYS